MDTTNYIEDYFNHRLTKQENQLFDEKLKSDEEFAKEVKNHALLINAFDEAKAEELSLRFKAIEKELSPPTAREFKIPVYLKWAATLLVLAMLSVLVYFNSNDPDADLFLAYYTSYPNVEKPVSRSGEARQDMWLYYENRNYAEAAKLFRRALSKNDADFAKWFYLGLCELEMNRVQEAENAFKRVIDNKEGKYFEQAQWYMALSYLKGGKESASKQILKAVEISNSSYSAKAKAILEELD